MGGLHIHIHQHADSDTKESLSLIHTKLNSIMAKQEQFDALIGRLNVATNDIAADLTNLKAQIAAGTVSDESLARLDSNIAALETLGASTENPVPETPAE